MNEVESVKKCSIGGRPHESKPSYLTRRQLTFRVTVVGVVVLGPAPFVSAPVRVKVYVFVGVIPLLVVLVEGELQPGRKSTLQASANSRRMPSTFLFLTAPAALMLTSSRPGSASHAA